MRRRPIIVHDPVDHARSAWSIIRTSLPGNEFRVLERTRDDQIDIHCINQRIVLPVLANGPFQHDMHPREMLETAAVALGIATSKGDPQREIAERAASYLLTFVEDLPDPVDGIAVRYSPVDRDGLPGLGVWDGTNGRWRDAALPEEAILTASLAFPIIVTPERVRPIGWQLRAHDDDVHCSAFPMDALDALRVSAAGRP